MGFLSRFVFLTVIISTAYAPLAYAGHEELCSFGTPQGYVSLFNRPPTPKVAIVIDDMGVDHARSMQAIELPAAVTLSYLPYAHRLEEQVSAARQKGHEVIVHLPMQPERKSANPGPDYLGVEMPPDEIRRRLEKNLAAFSGYDGVNNHMGSKFSQDKEGLTVVMDELKKRGLYFLDSRTSGRSVAEAVARARGLLTASRDVFIDDEDSYAFTEGALEKIEKLARRRGVVIAIGHPRDITLKKLKPWVQGLEKKGIELIPLRQAIQECNTFGPR